MQHPATLHQSAPGHGELGLGRVWLMINGHYKLQHSISLPHTLDTLSSFSTPNVHIMWICGWMQGPKSRHIFHCSPYHIGVSCFELTIQQRTVQHSQQIYITIQKFALSKWNAMMSFNDISEEHISGTLVNTVKASGFQNMKKTNHSPNVCPLPSMIRSDNFCIASNSRRRRRTRWTWFILSAPFHTCHVTALFCHSITIKSLVLVTTTSISYISETVEIIN